MAFALPSVMHARQLALPPINANTLHVTEATSLAKQILWDKTYEHFKYILLFIKHNILAIFIYQVEHRVNFQ